MPETSDVYQAVADPTRRRLLDLLAVAELPVSELAAPFDVSRPAISQHLRVLKDAGLVSERKVGRQRVYRLEAQPLSEIEQWIRRYERFWPDRLRELGAYLDTQELARHERAQLEGDEA